MESLLLSHSPFSKYFRSSEKGVYISLHTWLLAANDSITEQIVTQTHEKERKMYEPMALGFQMMAIMTAKTAITSIVAIRP